MASKPGDLPTSPGGQAVACPCFEASGAILPPMWMMRQAGRYLPEYRSLREEKGGFLDLVYDSEAAAEITLQPLKRFPELDAAILFSDILIVPFAIGQNLTLRGRRRSAPDADAASSEAWMS